MCGRKRRRVEETSVCVCVCVCVIKSIGQVYSHNARSKANYVNTAHAGLGGLCVEFDDAPANS